MPSFTSSAVPTSRTSISARSAAWISLRRISLSSPGLRMESVAMGCRLGDCESYHKSAECGMRSAEWPVQASNREPAIQDRTSLAIPHSEFRTPHFIRSEEHSLNSSHTVISYAVYCLKKKKKKTKQ